jgi:hypothetical protein
LLLDEQGCFRIGVVSDSVELVADQYTVLDCVGSDEGEKEEDLPVLEAFDSHFHADRLSKLLMGHSCGDS